MASVYVVDDDEQLLRMVGVMLERGGHAPTLINSPAEGLEQVREAKPDLLVLDVMMPGMSGHDICRQLRADKATADLPILILTARAQEIDRTTALKSGANDYLSKPVTAQELMEKIEALLSPGQSADGAPPEGTVISFFGMRGGVGRTTLAVNLAAALRRIGQEEVCLIDFSPSGGQVAMHLRLQSNASWANLPPIGDLDWESIRKELLVHQSGLRLLPAPVVPLSPARPSAEKARAILQLLRQQASFIVIDLPAVLSPAADAALTVSDMVFHVVAPEVISVQLASQSKRALAESGIELKQRAFILNQAQSEAQLPQAVVERGLNARLAFQIGYDANQLRALAQGVVLCLTTAQSPLPVTIRRVAEAVRQRAEA